MSQRAELLHPFIPCHSPLVGSGFGCSQGASAFSGLTSSVPLHCDNVDVSKILPHRYPFLLVDKVHAHEFIRINEAHHSIPPCKSRHSTQKCEGTQVVVDSGSKPHVPDL
eukprot:6477503-Amphidinium_carterae.1